MTLVLDIITFGEAKINNLKPVYKEKVKDRFKELRKIQGKETDKYE